MNTKIRYMLPAFAAVFALMFVAAAPYVIAEPGAENRWNGDGTYDHAKNYVKHDMTEKLNSYCEMSASEQAALIEEHGKTEEMVTKMNEYCSLDETGRQAFIEEHKDEYRKHLGDKMNHDYKKHHMAIEVEGFTGKITIPEEFSKEAMIGLKDQVTVTLSQALGAAEAAEDFNADDIMKAGIGIVKGQDDQKFVAWTLASMNMDVESETMSATIFVVDAADVENTAQITKEFDHSMMMGKDKKYSHDKEGIHKNMLSDPEQIENKITKIEKKIAEGGTGNTETDDLKSQFVNVLRQLQTAIADGDDVQADSLREQLNDLRSQMVDMKRFR